MTRERRDHHASRAPRPGHATDALPGKRTRVETYSDMIAALGVTPSQPLFQAGAAWEPIQRHDDPAVLGVTLQGELARIETAATGATTAELRTLAQQIETVRSQLAGVTDATARAGLEAQVARTQDELVRRFQELAADHADQTLQAWHSGDATKKQRDGTRTQYLKESGWPGAGTATEDWCGMFANTQFRAAGFAPELNLVFNHSENIAQFFGYADSNRIPQWIIPHDVGEKIAVRDYHEQRGSLRSWKSGADIEHDIRPGDIVAVDWEGTGGADHVFIVASYTPGESGQDGRLVSIDGNSYGARKTSGESPRFDGTDEMASTAETSETSDVSTSEYLRTGDDTFDRSAMLPDGIGHPTMRMLGRGRPSLVDFEAGHVYPEYTDRKARDPDGPSGELQSKEIQRAEAGAVATQDPAAAFDAATAGGASEVPHRDEMQRRLGADFSDVKAYTGRDLAPLGARAATRGEQVTFAEASPDKEVVAHELTHVLQGRQGRAGGAAVSDPGDASEHEARAVASAVTAGETATVSGAPSAAIHRDHEDMLPVHPKIGGNGRGVPIDWADDNYLVGADYRLPGSNTLPGSIGEVREFYMLRYFVSELPDIVAQYVAEHGPLPPETVRSLPDGRYLRRDAVSVLNGLVQTQIQELVDANDPDAANRLRIRLFAANEHALSETLLIPGSTRHLGSESVDADGKKTTTTWCNVYAFDVVTAMGGYLPRAWWTTDALDAIARGEHPGIHRAVEVDANNLYDWMLAWGVTQFGWEALTTPEEAQAEADRGQIVIILGSTGDKVAAGSSGHVSVVMTSTDTLKPPTRKETASAAAPDVDGPYVPLQSQAGGENFSTNAAGVDPAEVGPTGRRAWWTDNMYSNLEGSGVGFFVYRADRANRGFGELAIPTPEQMGTILPEGAPD